MPPDAQVSSGGLAFPAVAALDGVQDAEGTGVEGMALAPLRKREVEPFSELPLRLPRRLRSGRFSVRLTFCKWRLCRR